MIINQQKVEKAVQVLDILSTAFPNGFPKEMKGDISSFGAGIIQAGLLPSVLFFSEGDYTKSHKKEDEDDSTKLRRAKLMKVVFDVLEVDIAEANSRRPLLNYVRNNLGSADALDRITEAALAVKVGLRAFKFDEKTTPVHQINPPTP